MGPSLRPGGEPHRVSSPGSGKQRGRWCGREFSVHGESYPDSVTRKGLTLSADHGWASTKPRSIHPGPMRGSGVFLAGQRKRAINPAPDPQPRKDETRLCGFCGRHFTGSTARSRLPHEHQKPSSPSGAIRSQSGPSSNRYPGSHDGNSRSLRNLTKSRAPGLRALW